MKRLINDEANYWSHGRGLWAWALLSLLLATPISCSDHGEPDADGSNTNTDINSDAASELPDTDSDTDTEPDTDTEETTDSDSDTDNTDTGSDTDTEEEVELPLFKWGVDEAIQPFADALHPMTEGGATRPLSAVGGKEMPTATFVQNELVLFSDDDDAVSAFIARVGGERVFEEDPADSGVDGPRMHLIVVNDPAADMENMGADITLLAVESLMDDGEHGDQSTDGTDDDGAPLLFSDEEGAALIALAAREASSKELTVAINWVGEPTAIPDHTEEASNGTGGYRDAYDFNWFKGDTGMKTGVTDAWNLLHHGGRLDNSVKIAILDMGFKVTDDLDNVTATTVWPGFGPLNRENDYHCSGGSDCPWHGTDVAGAAMGIPDNQFGSAGSAGPVGEPVLVYTTYDYIASITAVYRARSKGAKIINMSYSAPVPWWLKWTVAGFRHATSAIRDSGVLLFAAAGNEHKNVDSKICFLGYCWEKTFYTPCENGGVTCVGGLSGPNTIDPSSNYGDGNVDLYGPWCVSVGPNPEDDEFHTSCGTSISSPFVAGVAALVWAANPNLSASDVSRILADTADGYREEKVNAYQAVLDAIGVLREITIISPAPGSEIIHGIPSPLTADITFVSTPGSPIDVEFTWYSSIDGELGTQETTVEREEGDVHSKRVLLDHLLSQGMHQLTVIAEMDRPGDIWGIMPPVIIQDTSTVLVTNPGPTVTIETPSADDTLCQGQPIMFRASGQDINQTLPNDAYSWISAVDTNPFPIFYLLGQGAIISTDELPVGEQRVTVTVTDNGGQNASDFLDIEIISSADLRCSNRPPQVVITSPATGAVIMATGYDEDGTYADIALQATATDYEDDDVSLTVEWYEDNQGLVGTGESPTARIYMTETCSSMHTVTAKVTDSDTNVAQDVISISIYIVC